MPGASGRPTSQHQTNSRPQPPGLSVSLITREGHLRPLTSLLGCFVVRFAHQPAVFHEVEFVPRGQLPLANHAGEAMQVVHEVLGAAHHLRGRDAQLACGALGPEAPAGCTGCGSADGLLRLERVSTQTAPRALGAVRKTPSALPCLLGQSHSTLGSRTCFLLLGKMGLEGRDLTWLSSLSFGKPEFPTSQIFKEQNIF